MSTDAPELIEDESTLDDRVARAVEERDADALQALLGPVPLSEELRLLLTLTTDKRSGFLELLPRDWAAELIGDAPNETAVDLLEHLEAETAAGILEEMDSDIQADLIGEMDTADAEAILAEFKDAEDAADIRRLADYEDDTAGGLMMAEAFSFPAGDTVGAVLRRLSSEDDDFERYRGQHPYVVDAEAKPIGVVSLRTLLTSKRSTPLVEVMAKPMTVSVDTTLDQLQDLFDEYPFLGMPVVEADGRLAGVVSRSAVDAAALERAESESMKRQGIIGDELRSMPLFLRSRRRLAWLSANIVLNILAASVISAYEETLAAVIAIAVFLPMVSDMSGCSGNQAVGVSMRELSLGLVRPGDTLRVWLKEVSVGVINGIALGILIGIVAWVWKGNPYLGLVIGAALSINTVIAVSIGGTVPLLLKRLGQDPAAASGPLLTTITDMAGFFLVLSLATVFLDKLV